MSRLERSMNKRIKKRKWIFIRRILFIVFMSFNLLICTYIIDKSAKDMLGHETLYITPFVNNIQAFINDKIKNLSDITDYIVGRLYE